MRIEVEKTACPECGGKMHIYLFTLRFSDNRFIKMGLALHLWKGKKVEPNKEEKGYIV